MDILSFGSLVIWEKPTEAQTGITPSFSRYSTSTKKRLDFPENKLFDKLRMTIPNPCTHKFWKKFAISVFYFFAKKISRNWLHTTTFHESVRGNKLRRVCFSIQPFRRTFGKNGSIVPNILNRSNSSVYPSVQLT